MQVNVGGAMSTAINDRLTVGPGSPLCLIAGPCALESRSQALEIAQTIKSEADKHGLSSIFKGSFDKANRTKLTSARGIGLNKSMDIFGEVREDMGMPVLTDVHAVDQCAIVAETVDVIQIPALLSRQTDLLIAASATGKVVNIKKGQFMPPWSMAAAVDKSRSTGNRRVLVTERGNCFGYDSIVVDMRSILSMRKTGCPVIFDGSHPGRPLIDDEDEGPQRRATLRALCRAAVAVGVAGIYIETHPDPDRAACDGDTSLALSSLPSFVAELATLDRTLRSNVYAQ